MRTEIAPPVSKTWRELYRAALFETDKNMMSERVAKAECTLAVRARELFHKGNEHLQERQAVDAAIYALYTLRRMTMCAARQEGMHEGKAA